jgi:ketosteroid isomerase-like protein
MTGLVRASTPVTPMEGGRSSSHHVVVGLGFLSALKSGDIDGCVEMLHPDVEWHPSPKLISSDASQGREQVRHQIQALYERFAELEIVPEDGRQVGDHVLIVALFKGRNLFTGQDTQARQCWVVTVRDDMWARIVVYPNAPAARLGFEEILQAAPAESRPLEAAPVAAARITDPPEAVRIGAPPHDADAVTPSALTLRFTLDEAAALNAWLLKPLQDGALVADDADAWPAFLKLRSAVEHAQALVEIRQELERTGAPVEHLGEDELKQLARGVARAMTPLV